MGKSTYVRDLKNELLFILSFFFQIGAINGSYEERVGLLRNGKINKGKLKFYRFATALGYLEYLLNPHESPFSVKSSSHVFEFFVFLWKVRKAIIWRRIYHATKKRLQI